LMKIEAPLIGFLPDKTVLESRARVDATDW
jgi:hypothetical protein